MEKVFVLGAGTMGTGIAQVFASNGYEVILSGRKNESLERGLVCINKGLSKMVEKDKITKEIKEEILSRISGTVDIESAESCDLIIESVVENIEIKKKLFIELDRICKTEAILASNTSSLSITEIAAATKRPDKVIGMHFFNPTPVMKLVEVIRGVATAQETCNKVKSISAAIGKEYVEVAEAPGFVVNRILIPMINEAITVFSEGTASAEDIDKAMMLGANHPMGPLALSDFIGNDIVLAIMDTLYRETGDSKYRACPLLKKYVRAGYLGKKTGRGFYNYTK